MKAYVLHGINDLRYEDVAVPVPSEGEVLVRVEAAGICGSDIPRIYTNGTYSYPLIPGHEFSGVVYDIGRGVDESFRNKRVGIFPLIPCGACGPCRDRKYEMCRKYSYLGSRTAGGFAEYAVVPVWNLIELPENVTFEQAAMMEPMSVAVHAMRRAAVLSGGPAPNQGQEAADGAGRGALSDENASGCAEGPAGRFEDSRIAICGLGTIGLLLAMFLMQRGAKKLLLIGNKPYQKKCALQLGIGEDAYCDGRAEDAGKWIDERTDGAGADLFFDCVGRNEVVELAVSHTAPGGTVLLVGNPASDMGLSRQTYWKILRNQLTVAGTWNSSFSHEETDDWNYVLDGLKKGRVHPERFITHRLSLEELQRGFELMRDKSEEYVKVMGVCLRE